MGGLVVGGWKKGDRLVALVEMVFVVFLDLENGFDELCLMWSHYGFLMVLKFSEHFLAVGWKQELMGQE